MEMDRVLTLNVEMPYTSIPHLRKPLQHASARAFICYDHFPHNVKKVAHQRNLPNGQYYVSNWIF